MYSLFVMQQKVPSSTTSFIVVKNANQVKSEREICKNENHLIESFMLDTFIAFK
jgi:hypothetical protein